MGDSNKGLNSAMTAMGDRRAIRARALAVALAGVGGALTVLAVVNYSMAGWPGGRLPILASAATAITWLATGVVTSWVRPRGPFGWLLMIGGLCLALSGMLTATAVVAARAGRLSEAAWTGWVGGWIFFPQLAAMAVVYLLFPTGRLISKRWRIWAVLAVIASVAATTVIALAPGPLASVGPLARVSSPIGGVTLPGALPVCVVLLNVSFVAGLVAMWRRRMTAERTLRPVLLLVFWLAVVNLAVGLFLVSPPGEWATVIGVPSTLCLTAAVSAGLIWGDLWDVRRTIGRILTYFVLTALVVGLFVGAVTASGYLFDSSVAGIAISALIVCVALAPAQQAIRRVIERALFGQRRDPYRVLSAFGSALETAGEPEAGLRRLAELAVENMRLPWLAVTLTASGVQPVVHVGTAGDAARAVQLSLHYRGAELGALVVGLRAGTSEFDRSDWKLLEDLARQAGAAAHVVTVTAELQRHRADLVAVREQERRRLRRDLHDGVASTLTAVGLKVDVARDLVFEDPTRSTALLTEARSAVATALDDVRRLVDDLGPSTLSDLGFRESMAELVRRFSSVALSTSLEDAVVGDLPPEVESAVYWIATEALHNATRHSGASHCDVHVLHQEETLQLTVSDDGIGIAESAADGVGLASMRLRAEEVGGSLVVGARHPRGTSVVARFRLATAVVVE